MEKELFDWTGWDGDPETMTFYDVTLKVDIGPYPAGSRFSAAVICQTPCDGKGVLQLLNFVQDETQTVAEFRLHYRVGERIN